MHQLPRSKTKAAEQARAFPSLWPIKTSLPAPTSHEVHQMSTRKCPFSMYLFLTQLSALTQSTKNAQNVNGCFPTPASKTISRISRWPALINDLVPNVFLPFLAKTTLSINNAKNTFRILRVNVIAAWLQL